MALFDFFQYPRLMTRILVTKGSTHQTTGAFTPGSEVEIAFTGHLQDVTLKQASQDSSGMLELGNRTLATDVELTLDDYVKVVEANGTTTRWKVKELPAMLQQFSRLTGETRYHYLLAKDKV